MKTHRDGREVLDLNKAADKREYKRRIEEMAARQKNRCALCGFRFDGYLGDPTFEHQDGRGMGGGLRDDRIEVDGKWKNAAAHGSCNTAKGSKRYRWEEGLNSTQMYYVPATLADWKAATPEA